MILQPLSDRDRDRAERLYLEAFPECERCPLEKLRAHTERDGVEWFGIYEDGDFKGMAYCLTDDRLFYLLYFAILPEYRNDGLGTRVLNEITSGNPDKKTYLYIESTLEESEDRETRVRRKAFYERNGFEQCGELRDPKCNFETMSCGGAIDPDELKVFNQRMRIDLLFGDGAEFIPNGCRSSSQHRPDPDNVRQRYR